MIVDYMYCYVFRTLLPAGLLAAAYGTAAAQSKLEATSAISPNGIESQTQTMPPVQPRLSRQTSQYFENHPGEWQQFLSQLPQVHVGPPQARPAGSPWQAVTANAPAAG